MLACRLVLLLAALAADACLCPLLAQAKARQPPDRNKNEKAIREGRLIRTDSIPEGGNKKPFSPKAQLLRTLRTFIARAMLPEVSFYPEGDSRPLASLSVTWPPPASFSLTMCTRSRALTRCCVLAAIVDFAASETNLYRIEQRRRAYLI